MQPTAQSGVAKSKAARHNRLAVLAVGLAMAAALVVLWVPAAPGATYTGTVAFSEGDLSFSAAGGYDVVALKDARWTRDAGRPRLPMVPVRLGLPAEAKVLGVAVVGCDSVILPGRFSVYPCQVPQPLASPRRAEFVEPDPTVYESSGLYPGRLLEIEGTGRLSGAGICEVAVYPLRYRPSSGELVLYTRIAFDLSYEMGLPAAPSRAASDDMTSLAARLVSDQVVPRRSSERAVRDLVPMGGSDVAYLIITNEALKSYFEPLWQWKLRKGLTSEIVTVETVASSFTGTDLQEKIRNAIEYYYANCGTQWVLLGGDTQIIPDRKVYVNLSDKTYIPCDLYYSDLDGTWNADGDLYWGETPSDNVDMYADVFVGRAPVATQAEAETFVKKVLTYEGLFALPEDYQLDMLFMGEILWGDPDFPSDPDYTDAAVAKDLIDNLYVPPAFEMHKLYQSAGNLGLTAAVSHMNQGMGFVNVLTHGHYKSINLASDALGIDDVQALASGSRYGLMYSAACLNGGFDQSDCIGETWVLSEQGGGFFIGNSRYGWDTPGEPGDGPSDYYDQSFFESVFSTGFTKVGKAHADAKHEYVGESKADPYMRYLMYGLNLLGDPETSLWTAAPRSMAVSCAAAIDTSPQLYTVSVSSGGAPLAGATVCLWKPEEVHVVGETGPDGNIGLPVDAASAGTLYVTVTGPNCLPFLGETSVEGAPPHPARPANLAAEEAGGPSVIIAWSPVDDEDLVSYRVFKNTAPAPQAYAVVAAPETAYTDSDVAAGTTYYYWVTALDGLGNESLVSDPCSVAVQGCVGVPDDGLSEPFTVVLTPNPFSESVRLVLEVVGEAGAGAAGPEAPAAARVYDVDGRCVTMLDFGGSGGRYQAVWQGTDADGNRLAPGLYLIEVARAGKAQTHKVILLK